MGINTVCLFIFGIVSFHLLLLMLLWIVFFFCITPVSVLENILATAITFSVGKLHYVASCIINIRE